jgi:hypothetical protein
MVIRSIIHCAPHLPSLGTKVTKYGGIYDIVFNSPKNVSNLCMYFEINGITKKRV